MVAPPGTHSGLSEGRRGRDWGRWGVCLPRLGGCGTDSGPCGLGGRGALLLGAGRWVGEGCLPLSPTPSPCSPLVLGPPALACLHCLQSRWPRSAQNSSRRLPRTECPSSARCLLSRVGVKPMAGGRGGGGHNVPKGLSPSILPLPWKEPLLGNGSRKAQVMIDGPKRGGNEGTWGDSWGGEWGRPGPSHRGVVWVKLGDTCEVHGMRSVQHM